MTIVVYVGNTGPTITGSLLEVKSNGSVGPIDLTIAAVSFRMRSQFGSLLVVDAPAVIVGDPLDGKVRYDLQLADTTTAIGNHPGSFKGWWHLDYGGGSVIDGPEFDVQFLSHDPRIGVGPCTDWCSSQDVTACYPEAQSGTCLASSTRMASEVLFEASGLQFPGWCQSVIRPCSTTGACFGCMQVLDRGHVLWSGESWCELDTGEPCGCGVWLSKVQLPGKPQRIIEVLIGGVIVDPSAYRLDPDGALIRTDGKGWPLCQNLAAPPTAAGTFQVTFDHGYEPPEVGRRAAAQLAYEFYKACNGGPCALPVGTVQVNRQGITITVAAARLFKEAATGMVLVDAFLSVFGRTNPAGLVMSPDTMPTERRVS